MNKYTDESTKNFLRDKIESQELFVPKEERKVSNLVNLNQEQCDLIKVLKEENSKIRQ